MLKTKYLINLNLILILIIIFNFQNKGIINLAQAEVLKNSKTVALTFDDGPSKYTPQILNILKKNKVKATFFLIGQNVSRNLNFVKQEIKEENVIANHTFGHKNLNHLSKIGIKKQLFKLEKILKLNNIFIKKMVRPPGGFCNSRTRHTLNNLDYKIVLWDIDTLDWRYHNSKIIYNNFLKGLKNVNNKKVKIILMHDGGGNRASTVKTLPKIIKYLQKKHYKFITL